MKPTLAKHAAKVRFGIVGSLNTLIDFGILFLLASFFGLPVLIANSVSVTVAFIFSFFANKNYTFKSKSKEGLFKQMVLFTIVTLFGLLVIQGTIVYILVAVFENLGLNRELSLMIGKLIATLASLVWNYLFYSRLVFKNPSER